ncbi:MAG TPA: chloramphenicol acetyltransferase, partial [Brachyspira hyodysenteriae]|nr:chloramphenicol acetyltransferase [Brachyspira hyodysenteriae]
MFNKIDLNNYNRKEHYEMYMNNIPCTYSIT